MNEYAFKFITEDGFKGSDVFYGASAFTVEREFLEAYGGYILTYERMSAEEAEARCLI